MNIIPFFFMNMKARQRFRVCVYCLLIYIYTKRERELVLVPVTLWYPDWRMGTALGFVSNLFPKTYQIFKKSTRNLPEVSVPGPNG